LGCALTNQDVSQAQLAEALGIHLKTHPLDDLLGVLSEKLVPLSLSTEPEEDNPKIIFACVQSLLTKLIAEQGRHLLLSAKNKSDLLLDCPSPLIGELAVLADVPKTLVHKIAAWLAQRETPALRPLLAIIDNEGLEIDQNRDVRSIPYAVLDPILDHHIDHGLDADMITSLGFDEASVSTILTLVRANEQRLRQSPLAIKVTSRAVGKKRRMPVAHRYKS
jgi:hypothetical protein